MQVGGRAGVSKKKTNSHAVSSFLSAVLNGLSTTGAPHTTRFSMVLAIQITLKQARMRRLLLVHPQMPIGHRQNPLEIEIHEHLQILRATTLTIMLAHHGLMMLLLELKEGMAPSSQNFYNCFLSVWNVAKAQ